MAFWGVGADANGTHGWLNDLWKFNPQTNDWAWMAGSSSVPGLDGGQPGTYGTMGTPSSGNIPGGRDSASKWTDDIGNLWLFGGTGFDANGNFGTLSDLWEFNPSANEWAWNGGSGVLSLTSYGVYDEPGIYGILGTPAPGNFPGSRGAAMTWTDASGNFWLFGGSGYDADGRNGDLNDLWRYQSASALNPTATPSFSLPSGTYSAAQTVTISDVTPGATIYYTTDGTSPTTGSSVYSGPISISSTETLRALAKASGYSSSAIIAATYTINLPPSFTVSGTAVNVAPGATTGNTSIITLTPSDGFTGAISLSCAITPTAASDPATCSIPASVTISGPSAQTTALTVNTTAASSASNHITDLFGRSLGGATLACILMVGIPAWRKGRSILGMLLLLLAAAGAALGCGGGSSGGGGANSGTTSGSYTITITGKSGSVVETGTISLTVR